ncbi:MAG: S41 family peptidase [Bacteroidetes bacterium]|nr:MAG: S41 family peptidase [Bacteroidota bacterium]TAG88477.1 MAG: S41 family peptidase [Bacteroidota bacterium]
MQNKFFSIFLPILLMSVLAIGVLIGSLFFGNKPILYPNSSQKSIQKIQEVLQYVQQNYADTVNFDKLTTIGLEKMIETLDPHSIYIPKQDVTEANMGLSANFVGIGIEFLILKDTLFVINTLKNSPSEKAGIKAGDKIIEVNQKNIAGKNNQISEKKVFELLRGKEGTEVKLGILRYNSKKNQTKNIITKTIKRVTFPTQSIEISLMWDKNTGFIKISRFNINSYKDFRKELKKLIDLGMKKLILDVRDNPGGYLDNAVNIVDEMLAGKDTIVYTDGKGKRFDNISKAKNKGIFESGKIIVLIDEGSASASEVLAGALQDYDRATLVGRRTYGKGLVQMPIELSDGAELRLTIAKYYTPSGRCIQKPFSKNYRRETAERYSSGELFEEKNIKIDKKQIFKTKKGRKVYGGGGITPDIFVALDTNQLNKLSQWTDEDVLRIFVLNYINENQNKLSKISFEKFIKEFNFDDIFWNQLWKIGKNAKIESTPEQYKKLRPELTKNIKEMIAKSIFSDENFWRLSLLQDEIFNKALEKL